MTAWAGIIGAAVGGILSIAAALLTQRMQARHRKAEILLQERVRELRPLAREIGAVTERVCSWGWSGQHQANDLATAISRVEDHAGAIWGDRDARQGLRDWAHAARILIDLRLRHEDARDESTELDRKAEVLIAQIEAMQIQ